MPQDGVKPGPPGVFQLQKGVASPGLSPLADAVVLEEVIPFLDPWLLHHQMDEQQWEFIHITDAITIACDQTSAQLVLFNPLIIGPQ